MDGNRRWARAQDLPTLEGHTKGYYNLRELSRYIFKQKHIPFLTVYAFSSENWSRTKAEVSYLMKLVARALDEFMEECQAEDLRIVVLGRRDRLSKKVLKAVEQAEASTRDNRSGTLAICFNYGGQQEIVDAAKSLAEQRIPADQIDPEKFAQQLYHPEVPAVDLLIRTSGEQRLSGFMLWRAAYSELYFIDKHWPAMTKQDIDKALDEYASRQRRYGK